LVLGIHLHSKKKVEEAEDMAAPMYANTAINNVTAPRGPGERSDRRELGTDIYLLEATEAINVIKNLAYATKTITSGVPYDDHGITKILERTETFDSGKPWAQAILIYLDTIWPTIWMSAWEADTKKLVIRTAFYDIKKSMSKEDRMVYRTVVNACMNLCIARLEDCKDGHKDMIVKIDTHKLEVSTNRSMTNAK
jgi:hypothetical protein